MIRSTKLCLSALALIPAPASAASYVGTLTGTITSGEASYADYVTDENSYSVDLSGKKVTIDFNVTTTPNYDDGYGDNLYTRIVSDFTVKIPAPDPFSAYGSSQTNDPFVSFGGTDFTGDAQHGTFSATGSAFFDDPDFVTSIDLTYANASRFGGPLTGSGTASGMYFVPGDPGANDQYSITFTLTAGKVVDLAAPEPGTWALMLLGFGAVGAMTRRQRVRFGIFNCG
jgi:hypothetical protein